MTNLNEKAEIINAIALSFITQLSAIMPVQNSSPAGLSALQASLLRGKEMVK